MCKNLLDNFERGQQGQKRGPAIMMNEHLHVNKRPRTTMSSTTITQSHNTYNHGGARVQTTLQMTQSHTNTQHGQTFEQTISIESRPFGSNPSLLARVNRFLNDKLEQVDGMMEHNQNDSNIGTLTKKRETFLNLQHKFVENNNDCK
mmetsp:Transcript_9014/g.9997  ORF Transcript_9014/g.9997 Transcript_9014/m.9997 type:complete len:147 (+) Transcript_9014:470-910(+)